MSDTSDAALESFRKETRDWLAQNCPPEMRQPILGEDDVYGGGRNGTFQSDAQRVWFERMRDRKWVVPHWPAEYGGGGLDPARAKIVREEMAAIHARPPLRGMGISMIGPALLKYGNEEQKREHIPKILSGEIRWCQGYSEPNSGSDLASLQTRADLDGDHYIINGSKIWTSYAHKSDWIFCLVRTDFAAKKHEGISFILFDMTTPGVTPKPIVLISGYSVFCETFFDNVRAPAKNILGTVNKGWDVAKYLLQFERDSISGIGDRGAKRSMSDIATSQVGTDDKGRLADPQLRAQLAAFEIDEIAFKYASERASDQMKVGQAHPSFSAAMKYYGSELNKRRHELYMSMGGSDALEWESERSQGGLAPRSWLRTKANSIEGGTSEVMLGIVAKRILNLPGA
jgi:alkylation response protein AidB-like acyl-CoA dehydrogenase